MFHLINTIQPALGSMTEVEEVGINDTKGDVVGDEMDVDDEEEERSSEVGNNDNDEDDDDDDDDHDDEEEEEDDEPVESLVSGRQKRATAGSKYQQLLNATLREDAEDEVSLLFAEEGEDEEFDETKVEDAAAEGDEDDSSTDEEDQAGGQDDELAGEKELEKQERAAKRAQKRKAEQAMAKAAPSRKKVKIETPAESSRRASETPAVVKPAGRTRKRSERVSWLPVEADGRVRTSSRTLSVQNKERTLESMKESEARRIRQLEVIENAQKKKESVKVHPMTQAQRMAEAARIARINSKSLNTWEEAEAERSARQKARLDALHNRTLEGPVIRWYSGPAEWTDGKLTYVGRRPKIEEIVEVVEENKEKDASIPTHELAIQSLPTVALPADQQIPGSGNQDLDIQTPKEISQAAPQPIPPTEPERTSGVSADLAGALSSAVPPSGSAAVSVTPAARNDRQSDTLLDELEYYASLNEESGGTVTTKNGTQSANTISSDVRQDHSLAVRASASIEPENTLKTIDSPRAADSQRPDTIPKPEEKPTFIIHDDTARLPPAQNTFNPSPQPITLPAQPPPPPKEITYSAHQSLTLLNYPPTTPLHTRDILRRILFAWPSPSHLPNTTSSMLPTYASTSTAGTAPTTTSTGAPKRAKKEEISAFTALKPLPPICVISGREARYRDPMTGLPYRGINEFKSLRGLAGTPANGEEGVGQGPIWSALLGAYVGAGGRRGNPRVPPTTGVVAASGGAAAVQRESVEAIKWRAAAKVPEAFVGAVASMPVPVPVLPSPAPAASTDIRGHELAVSSLSSEQAK